MKRKDGFISMTLVYTFLIVFLFLMVSILNSYTEKDTFLETINSQIEDDITNNTRVRNTLISSILRDNTPQAMEDSTNMNKRYISIIDISNAAHTNGEGLIYTQNPDVIDENVDGVTGRIYFFRGEIETNHLIYAEKCFRIIRTNEDGSLRIRYNGNIIKKTINGKQVDTCATTKEVKNGVNISIGSTKWNEDSSLEKYTGYIYKENETDTLVADDENLRSLVKDKLDEWYLTNIINKKDTNGVSWENGVSRALYCNDRTYSSLRITPRFIDDHDHSIYNKANITNSPTWRCSGLLDRYTIVTDTNGNRLLFYPVGLVTATDVALAGGYLTHEKDLYAGGSIGMENKGYYMYTGRNYYTMSPYGYENGVAEMIYVEGTTGTMKKTPVTSTMDIIPVISIKGSNEIVSGMGTSDNPYIVKMEAQNE